MKTLVVEIQMADDADTKAEMANVAAALEGYDVQAIFWKPERERITYQVNAEGVENLEEATAAAVRRAEQSRRWQG